LRGGCIYLVFKGVVFSENETRMRGQVVVGPIQKRLFGVQSSYNAMGCNDGFRRTKVPLKVAFFVWPAALGRSLPWTISESSISLWLIGVVCVKEMGVCTPSSSFFDE
jgi:hypothetical protein